MNRRSALSSIHRRLARQEPRELHTAAADVPFERLSIAALDRAGASLLPHHEDEPTRCAYCGEVDDKAHDAARCAINAENS